MEETYKDYKITYDGHLEKFKVVIGDGDYKNSNLSSVRKYIDRLDKKDFKRVAVIIKDWEGLSDAIVTSFPENQEHSNYKECWVSFKDKSKYHQRSKISINQVFLDNPHNRKIFRQMEEKEDLIKKVKDQEEELRKSLETYKP